MQLSCAPPWGVVHSSGWLCRSPAISKSVKGEWLCEGSLRYLLRQLFCGGGAHAQQQVITYEPVNVVTNSAGTEISGDIRVVRNSGVNELIPFHATTNRASTPGSIYLPPLNNQPFVTRNLGPRGGGGGNPPTQPQVWPIIVAPAVCLVSTAMVRGWCSSDCKATGVANWDSGVCGHKSTCVCMPPPNPEPPRPPRPRTSGEAFPTGHLPFHRTINQDYWVIDVHGY